MKIISLQQVRKKRHHVSYDTVIGMENSFAENGGMLLFFTPLIGFLNKIFRKLRLKISIKDVFLTKKVAENEEILFIAMGYSDIEENLRDLKTLSSKSRLGLYCFDVWQPQFDKWKELFNAINPSVIFFAYKNAQAYFKDYYTSVFVPQSANQTFFFPRDVDKTRMFIQMGRRNDAIHNMILLYMSRHGITLNDENYIFEKQRGKLLFTDTNKLAENICKSKYFIAAPKSAQDKELTGNISDVTARFYEAMACKTMIVGFKPDTFDELFPPDAMIEIRDDGTDFDEKISWMENNPDYYNRIVERNYRILIDKNTWTERFKYILNGFSES